MLLYLPIKQGSLLNRYFDPCVDRVNDTEYVITMSDMNRESRYCHINLLKGYIDRLPIVPSPDWESFNPL